ncbi:MAG: hypothetical protein JW704_02170 [Anaerolineaceae bacterium]|nr:hypothetical protein [Anaerolineaceae bacterium]MBN2677016.1 hypothetical protein [Anaerolineaceae bacterium]
MKLITNARQLMLIWLAWAVLISAFQFWSSQRVKLTLPDNVLRWTASESNPGVLFNKRYLNDPFLNEHVAWDSEYYLSIAMEGYDDPEIRGIPFTGDKGYYAGFCIVGESSRCISLSHGFFPLYPLLMRALAAVLAFLPISAIARFTLAGVLVSLLGTLAAMFALRQLMDETTEETDRLRAVFYLLVFPGAIFLAQVYSEGLFLGLSFSALACLRLRKWLPTAILAALAFWVRPGGALLIVPLVTVWWLDRSWRKGPQTALLTGLAALTPLFSYLVFSITDLAKNFRVFEVRFFGSGRTDVPCATQVASLGLPHEHFWMYDLPGSISGWVSALQPLTMLVPQRVFYYGIEIAAVLLALVACLILLKKQPEIALYGLALIIASLLSGSPQSMLRYMAAVPAVYLVLAKWGRHPVFDRIWTLLSCLLLGLLALLFSANYWIG